MVFPITVFAGGLGQLYPKGNLDVFRQTVQRGGILISERLWNTPALPMDFPVRNRIVSGLSPETLVIEANRRSGALITARLALDQGRDVGVLNLPQNYQGGAGNHWLVDQGAMKFSDAQHWFHSRCMKERQMD
jgi:DNA processing protein